MGVLAKTAVKIEADTANFHKDASRGVLKSIDSVGKDAKSRATKTFGDIGKAAKYAGAAGFVALGFAVKDVVSDFLEDDKAARQTTAVLKSTGGAANVTAGHVGRLATAIRDKTGIDDASVQAGENMLLTFTKVRNETGKGNAIFDQATKATANLSVAMGKDMTSSAMLVGKALNDPVKGMTALSRAGIQFTEGQKEAIKQMVKTGDTMGAQKIIMKELETQFGGSAEAAGKSLGGQLNILKGRLEDMAGVLVAKVMPYLLRFITYINANMPAIQAAFQTAFAAISQAIDVAVAAFHDLSSVVETVLGFLTEHVGSVKEMAVALGVGAAAVVVLTAAVKAYTIAQAALNAVMSANPITLVIIAIAALVVGLTLLYQRSETARKIMDAAWAAIKAGAQAALEFITNTLIPNAIAAWERFGPRVVAIIQTAAAGIKTAVEVIRAVVMAVVDFVADHWEAAWRIIGPVVRAQFEIVKTAVQTALNVIAGVVRLFAALLRGDWSAAWNALKGIVSDVISGVVSIVGSMLRGLAGTAKALAVAVGTAIANGIKTAPAKLAGLAGDLLGKLASVAGQLVGAMPGMFASIGKAIADGIVSGVGDLAGALGSKLKSAIGSAKDSVAGWAHIKSPSQLFADDIGAPIGEGIVLGATTALDKLTPALVPKIRATADALRGATAEEGKKIAEGFGKWASDAKAAYDAKADLILASVDAQFSKAQAALEKWKAKLTPAEAQIAAAEARAAAVSAQAAVDKAWLDLKALPAAQKVALDTLVAQQQAAMAQLQATLTHTTTDAVTAQHDFNQALATASPAGQMAVTAQANADAARVAFEQGLISEQQYLAAHDALQAAELAIDGDADAQKLLADYNTWQGLVAQQQAAGAAITAQQAADAAAQASLQAQQNQQTLDATAAKDAALQGLLDYNLGEVAKKERADRDRAATELNKALVARHDRYITHFENVKKIHDRAFDDLAKIAKDGGGKIGNDLADALTNTIPRIARAAKSVADELRKYLKLSSPSEKGPLSDLDRWWKALAPTLVASLDTSMIKGALSDAVTPTSGGFGAGAASRQTLSLNDGALMQKLGELVDELRRNQQGASPVTVIASGGAQAAVIGARR